MIKVLTLFASLIVALPCLGLDILSNMSLDEKVGQILMAHFHGESANDDAQILIQKLKIGGIIYYDWSNGLTSPDQVCALSLGLQKLAQENELPIPLLIGIDQEGGVVNRINHGFTEFPGNQALGETDDPDLAEQAAHIMGQELFAVGINIDFAPVVDVNQNPCNPVIGVRSFGDTPEIVTAFGKKAISGFHQANILTTLKHFPGHGDVQQDSHEDLPVVRKTLEELEKIDLVPFAKLAPFADAVMTAHLLVPALDQENCSTLSEKTLHYLKENLGFEGVIISDSLVMEGVLKKYQSIDETAIQALKAGCDLLLLGGKQLNGEYVNFELDVNDVQRIHTSLVNAVKENRIPEERLNEAVKKILKMKERLHHQNPNLQESEFIAQKIAASALNMIERDTNSLFPLSQKNIAIFAPEILSKNIARTLFTQLGKETNFFYFHASNLSFAKKADVIMIFTYNAWKNPVQMAFIQSLLSLETPLILIVMRDPIDATFFPSANLVFKTFSPTAVSLRAVYDALQK